MKIRSVFSLFLTVCLLVFSACFQPVDIGETFVEKGTAHLRVTNDSADEDYILEGLELRNAEGAAVWEGLNLSKGQSWEVHTETAGTFTLWYRVKDTWFSTSEVKAHDGGPVEIALNKSHEFLFEGEKFDATQQDSDDDGYPDAWEEENGFDPNDSGDGGVVYVKANGQDEAPGNGTRDHPYKTLAKAVAKAGRGLSPAIRTVVVTGPAPLSWGTGGNEPNNLEFPGREDSVFYLGKTRDRVTIRGEDPDNPGILTAETVSNKRVLYLDSGADIAFQDIRITKGQHIGGGVYASGATLTLGPGAKITDNQSYDAAKDCGGVYMERGILVMEEGSSIDNNTGYIGGGIKIVASRLIMNGGAITLNTGGRNGAGLWANSSIVEMKNNAEISHNTAGSASLSRAGGGGVILSLSELTMEGTSQITGNIIYNGFGGGVFISGESAMTMKGDSAILENKCEYISYTYNGGFNGSGGGVALTNGSSFTMEGGIIAKNTAQKAGGGLSIAHGTTFTMRGGTIYGADATYKNNITETTGDYVGGTAIAVFGANGQNDKKYEVDVTTNNCP